MEDTDMQHHPFEQSMEFKDDDDDDDWSLEGDALHWENRRRSSEVRNLSIASSSQHRFWKYLLLLLVRERLFH